MAERVIVGMSGGVDSSVAAALLVEQGFEVVGVTMRVWPRRVPGGAEQRFGSCCGTEAVDDARRVARTLGIPYYVLDMADEFERAVVDRFAAAYRAGLTPVPCVACNNDLKFGSLLARARAWDAVAVATGHYARVERDASSRRWRLLRAVDLSRDQTDFLWPLGQEQLAAARFPVGGLTKAQVRAYARQLGLATADKPESREICFVPDGDYRDFLRRRDPAIFRPGPIVDQAGRELGRHTGIAGFTVGQRRGLGVATGRPLYVVGLDERRNAVVVGTADALECPVLRAEPASFVSGAPPAEPIAIEAKIRHQHAAAPATIRTLGSTAVELRFAEPQRAVTPGQSVVFYQGEEVLGGGVIRRSGA